MRRFLFLLALVGLAGCDWGHFHLMNSVPFHGDPAKNPVVAVYLGVDGLSHNTILDIQKRGAFTGEGWNLAKFHTMFPGTSDASWSRILHTDPIPGYEFEHYDPVRDQIENSGLLGYLCHAMPNLGSGLHFDPPYYNAFDYRSNGYTHTVGAYADTHSNYSESLDNLFTVLEGRAETQTEFTAYMLELDVMGHMKSRQEIADGMVRLWQRIQRFKERHPERKFVFTLFSDHGMDFIPVVRQGLVRFPEEMKKVGVEPVESLGGLDAKRGAYALTINHTRVTYLELHTDPRLTETVANLVSGIGPVDVALSRIAPPDGEPSGNGVQWFALWERNKASGTFAFDPANDRYYVSKDFPFRRFGITDPIPVREWISDEVAFQGTRHALYPDLFYRVRTALEPISVKYPAQVVVSLKGGFASVGKELPGGASDMAMSAFHGALDAPGTVGTLLTEERPLPDAVRSDNVLDLFPRLRKHLERRGVRLNPGDKNAPLNY